MSKKILVDGSQSEEIRVAIIDEKKSLIDYEFEVTRKEDLKGNIYLAKISKVEASLQAAFVDYGGNKQGFLPFNEIALSYFNIPKEKINEILAKQTKQKELKEQTGKEKLEPSKKTANYKVANAESTSEEDVAENKNTYSVASSDEISEENSNKDLPSLVEEKEENEEKPAANFSDLSDEDILSDLENPQYDYGTRYGYKIEDVIKPNQYILVQVTKEERGNKGVSLTTLLSLPGRYCVLMPNTPFEGGISKKINNSDDRNRLKNIINNLNVNKDNNVIIRTASLEQKDEEIIQDYKYLENLWKHIRKQSKEMKSPGLIYEEGSLVKKIIRDFFSNDTDSIIVQGREIYQSIKKFAKHIAPSVLDKIQPFKHPKFTLFNYYNIESEVQSIYSPVVFLENGGYIVINITEALIAIDVNSGKAKGRRSIEENAVKTNIDAAITIAKQLRLRDLGGIVVIDFIDMENPKNRALVERKFKEEIRKDKAKTQVGVISNFGLLEVSRQRIKSSIIERSFNLCSKCKGYGYTKPLEINALGIIRNIIHDISTGKIKPKKEVNDIIIELPSEEAFYILNNKRHDLNQVENVLRTSVSIECNDNLDYPFYKIKEKNSSAKEETMSFLQIAIENNSFEDIIPSKGNNPNKKPNHKKAPINNAPKEVSPPSSKSKWLKKILGF